MLLLGFHLDNDLKLEFENNFKNDLVFIENIMSFMEAIKSRKYEAIASGASSALEPLASASGGSVEDSSSPDDLAGLIDGAMAAETSKPFTWIQGDYVIQADNSHYEIGRASCRERV